jgi:hypothetical protein
LQEIGLENGYPSVILNLPHHELESKTNLIKPRIGLYIKSQLSMPGDMILKVQTPT